MRKGILPLLGLVAFLAILLAPVTSYAATSARSAKPSTSHVFPSRRNPSAGSAHISAFSAASAASAVGPVLTYHGGPVMAGTTHVYAIFWEPPTGSVSANYNSLINRYFSDVGGSPLYQNLRQYTQTGNAFPANAVLAASWVDTGAYPANPVLDVDIQNEVTHAQSANGWVSSSSNIFFVFTEKDEGVCIDSARKQCTPGLVPATSGFCAYHGSYGSNNTIYAAMPYAGSPTFNGGCTPGAPNAPAVAGSYPNNDSADLSINLTSHEQMEAATDPLGNGWVTSNFEIGDLCAWTFGPNNSHSGDVTWNNNTYIVQQEWDNTINGCALSGNHTIKYYALQNLNSRLVLDVLGASMARGAQPVQWVNHNGLSQQWTLVADGPFYQIVNRHSGMVLDVLGASTLQGALTVQWTNHHGPSQEWYLVPDGANDQIVNLNSGKVLDIFHAKLTNGVQAVQWGGHNGNSQRWGFTALQPYVAILNANSSQVLDINQGSTASGANVIQWPYQNKNSQQWAVVADGTRNGTPIYQIVNINSGMVLDVFHAQKTDGIQVVQWANHNGTSQQWFVIPDGTRNSLPIYLIKNVNSGEVLDVFHARKNAGTSVVQWSAHNGVSQQWSLIATSA